MKDRNFNYVKSLTTFQRQQTSEVIIGGVGVGGDNPIRIQSMTDTNTNDTEATVEQIERIVKEGADFVRMAVPGIKEAENLKNIKRALVEKGINTPLIADIHFNPAAAYEALKHVSKVRINPGNFYDPRAKFKKIEYTHEEYQEELTKIEQKFIPFLEECSKHNTAIRIGANQGSLSDRIMSRYGDTPAGIVESVMEYLRICQKVNFKNVVISIKSSNTRIMVFTVRLMNYRMRLEEMNFPFHIGVTEAGEGEDGRVKSAVGSGTLLADGLGDTIRVSLTEKPENEVKFAKQLISYINKRRGHDHIDAPMFAQTNPFEYERRSQRPIGNIGGRQKNVVVASLNGCSLEEVRSFRDNTIPEYFYDGADIFSLDGEKLPIISLHEYLFEDFHHRKPRFVRMNKNEYDQFKRLNPEVVEKLKRERNVVILMESINQNPTAEMRAFFMELDAAICKNPVILLRQYQENDMNMLRINSAADLGELLIDGYCDGILISNKGSIGYSELKNLSYSLLQASRMRVTKTEFVSCPGCGRTLFELHSTVGTIKKHFSHLNHLKIGVMGCIVNGPGEMGDVDYGYVGSSVGKVNLYKGQRLVKKMIPSEDAVAEMIELMKEYGDWREPDNS
ncbi:(E)-4-hydroxy-3-methylbut-2-enyl-diphosphate synthase [Halosquirtibacter laminarini]|uniref:(E)-4-hydroxy-3-methylbut-2-enyl-diphosphate synthase n=1 Tax=Halosquirtibacter laminarini TaxID=3374600 RepID=A0AC61NEX2_9BACT|nr:(E)-4-hydroxy-3-methylbut-2-enyl-diphosphate synthase [Prolixibacteraceae bacterium]